MFEITSCCGSSKEMEPDVLIITHQATMLSAALKNIRLMNQENANSQSHTFNVIRNIHQKTHITIFLILIDQRQFNAWRFSAMTGSNRQRHITRHDYKHVSRFSLCKLRRKDTEWKIMSCHQKPDHEATTERYFVTLLQCLITLYKCAWPRLAGAEVIRPHEERHRQDLNPGISFKCDVKVLLCITPSCPWTNRPHYNIQGSGSGVPDVITE
ncbi:hypothetical protein Anapl_00817 [Anas platyrhynchos]|uniref:Uncharacterized protein n=1 Tax=Anas platyrhynchos TaxID=8839 RepID=R0K7Y0_ANAPL|nr:hypothetical protein Anapl_00817 [Anas platyrhynchos]